MNKITFESVMEEIKKSLGEARLKSINEYVRTSDDEEGPRKDMPGFKATPEPSADSLYDKAGSQDNAPKPAAPAKPATTTDVKTAIGDTGPKKIGDFGANAFGNAPPKPEPQKVDVKTAIGDTGPKKIGDFGANAFGNAPGTAKPSTPAAPRPSTPAPKASAPAPKAPAPSGPVTSYDDDSNSAYWNKEAERNRAQGGKPLPNEFNIFGKKETPAPAAPSPAPRAATPSAPRASAPRPAPRAATPSPEPTPGISGSDNPQGIEGKMDTTPKPFAPKGPGYNNPVLNKSNPNLRGPAPKFKEAGAVPRSNMAENFDQFVKRFIKGS